VYPKVYSVHSVVQLKCGPDDDATSRKMTCCNFVHNLWYIGGVVVNLERLF
jgi:hypothetical protein